MSVRLPPPILPYGPSGSSRRPRGGGGAGRWVFALFLLLGLSGAGGWLLHHWRFVHREKAFDAVIEEAARRNNVPASLVKALIRQESNFRPGAVGRAGEIGLMQVMPGAVRDWERVTGQRCRTLGMVFDPRLNIEIGSWYLSQGMSRWRGQKDQVILALAQYNAGATNATKWAREPAGKDPLDRIRFPPTRQYIKHILRYRDHYEQQSKRE